MGYMEIPNLYKDQSILLFRKGYELEKIHGTSTHIKISPNDKTGADIKFFSGGVSHESFVALFNQPEIIEIYRENFDFDLQIFGEGCGGKCQRMSHAYGDKLMFASFEVKIGDVWLTPPKAEKICKMFGFYFVEYSEIPFEMEVIDAARDKPSGLALHLGLGEQEREGIILRPPFEVVLNNGRRLMNKHKNPNFCETASKREVNPEKAKELSDATEIALEWVTGMRLNHVVDNVAATIQVPMDELGMEHTKHIVDGMIRDVYKEGDNIPDTVAVKKAIGSMAAKLWKKSFTDKLK